MTIFCYLMRPKISSRTSFAARLSFVKQKIQSCYKTKRFCSPKNRFHIFKRNRQQFLFLCFFYLIEFIQRCEIYSSEKLFCLLGNRICCFTLQNLLLPGYARTKLLQFLPGLKSIPHKSSWRQIFFQFGSSFTFV